MKQLFSTEEGVWKELKPVELTQEEKELLKSADSANKESKRALIERVKSEREVVASKKDTNFMKSEYSKIKPVLNEGDVYQLLGVNCTVNDDKVSGILNCRVNGKHIQVRF